MFSDYYGFMGYCMKKALVGHLACGVTEPCVDLPKSILNTAYFKNTRKCQLKISNDLPRGLKGKKRDQKQVQNGSSDTKQLYRQAV